MKYLLLLLAMNASASMASTNLHCDSENNDIEGGIDVTITQSIDGRVLIDLLGDKEVQVTDKNYTYLKQGSSGKSYDFVFQLNRYSLNLQFGFRLDDGQWIDGSGQCNIVASEPKI